MVSLISSVAVGATNEGATRGVQKRVNPTVNIEFGRFEFNHTSPIESNFSKNVGLIGLPIEPA